MMYKIVVQYLVAVKVAVTIRVAEQRSPICRLCIEQFELPSPGHTIIQITFKHRSQGLLRASLRFLKTTESTPN